MPYLEARVCEMGPEQSGTISDNEKDGDNKGDYSIVLDGSRVAVLTRTLRCAGLKPVSQKILIINNQNSLLLAVGQFTRFSHGEISLM